MALLMRLIQRPQLLFRVRRPVVQADDPHGDAEAPAVAIYVADEDGEDVFVKDGGGHGSHLRSESRRSGTVSAQTPSGGFGGLG